MHWIDEKCYILGLIQNLGDIPSNGSEPQTVFFDNDIFLLVSLRLSIG